LLIKWYWFKTQLLLLALLSRHVLMKFILAYLLHFRLC